MRFPALFGPGEVIQLRRLTLSGSDSHGNPLRSYTPPEPVKVYGVAPTVATESQDPGQDFTEESSWTIYAQADVDVNPFDEVILPSGEITEVIGRPKVWRNTPFVDFLKVSGSQFVVVEKK